MGQRGGEGKGAGRRVSGSEKSNERREQFRRDSRGPSCPVRGAHHRGQKDHAPFPSRPRTRRRVSSAMAPEHECSARVSRCLAARGGTPLSVVQHRWCYASHFDRSYFSKGGPFAFRDFHRGHGIILSVKCS